MPDQKQIIQDMKQSGFTYTALVNSLIQARTQMRNTLEALNKEFPGMDTHKEFTDLEAALKNYDALIELYR